MASQTRESKQQESISVTSCKAQFQRWVKTCLEGIKGSYSSEGCQLDIDQGYQRQPECDKYWHRKL